MRSWPVHLRFLQRVRRRWIVWRIVESAGVWAAASAGVGLAIVLVLLVRREPALFAAMVFLSLGAVAGVFYGLTRRPTILQTAMIVDRQLGLCDLLSSALVRQAWIDEQFRKGVLAQADAVCERTSPNELIVRRLGGRAWGGVGIASALLMTLAMMSAQPMNSQARNAPSMDQTNRSSHTPFSQIPTGSQPGLTDQTSRQNARESQSGLENDEASGDRWHSPGVTASKSMKSSGKNEDGGGVASGQTGDANIPRLTNGDGKASPESQVGAPAAGGGGVSAGQHSDEAAGGAGNSIQTPVPNWQGPTWPADRAVARQELEAGVIPDGYRDLIRQYFDFAGQ